MGLKARAEYHAQWQRPTRRRRIVEAGRDQFGIAVLDERIGKADVSVPGDGRGGPPALGDREFLDGKGRTITLGEALDRVPQSRFETRRVPRHTVPSVRPQAAGRAVGSNACCGTRFTSDAAERPAISDWRSSLNFCFASASGSSVGVEAFDVTSFISTTSPTAVDPAVRDDDARVPVDAPSEQLMVELREKRKPGLRPSDRAYVLDLADERRCSNTPRDRQDVISPEQFIFDTVTSAPNKRSLSNDLPVRRCPRRFRFAPRQLTSRDRESRFS